MLGKGITPVVVVEEEVMEKEIGAREELGTDKHNENSTFIASFGGPPFSEFWNPRK